MSGIAVANRVFSLVSRLHVIVVGDFFVDRHIVIDPALEERSLETGLPAHQGVSVRTSPGGAGNVAANLAALGVGRVEVVGVIGDDGDGWTLRRDLARFGVLDSLVVEPARLTPSYIKPRVLGGEQQRLDIRTREDVSADAEAEIVARLVRADGVLVVDQLPRHGVVSDGIVNVLRHLDVRCLIDSRAGISRFDFGHLKPNLQEATVALGDGTPLEHARTLARRARQAAFVTCGPAGMAVGTPEEAQMVAAPLLDEPVDAVGAGDTAGAALLCALCAGLSAREAARFAVAAAAVTVRKVGVTGTATRAEIETMLGRHA